MSEFNILDELYPNKKTHIEKKILKQTLIAITTHGWNNTTLELIINESECSTRSFYKNFNNKEHVVATLLKIAMADLFKYRQAYLFESKNFEESIYALVLSYIDWIVDHPSFAKILLSKFLYIYLKEYKNELFEIQSHNRKRLIEWMRQYKYAALLEDRVSLDLYSTFINGPVEYYCECWLLNQMSTHPKKYRKKIAQASWNSIKNLL